MKKKQLEKLILEDHLLNEQALGLIEIARDDNSIHVVLDYASDAIAKVIEWDKQPFYTGIITLDPLPGTKKYRAKVVLTEEALNLQISISADVVLINHAQLFYGRICNSDDGLSVHSLRDGRYAVNIRIGGAEVYQNLSSLDHKSWGKNPDGSSVLSQKLVNNICEAFSQTNVFDFN